MVGGPMLMALFVRYLALASLVPFAGGLLGVSRRIVYCFTALLVGGLILLQAWTFPDELKYQSAYRLLLVHFESAAIFSFELFVVFGVSHWLGAGLRAGIGCVKDRVLSVRR